MTGYNFVCDASLTDESVHGHLHVIVYGRDCMVYKSVKQYGFVHIFTEKHNLLWIENAEYGFARLQPHPF